MIRSIRLLHTLTIPAILSVGLAPRTADAQLPAVTRPTAFAELSESARAIRDSIVAIARAQVGTPYRLGGRSPQRGFDCSGFVQFVLARFRHELPRTAAQQATAGVAVARDTSRLRPGDLLTFGSGRRISHVGIYIGEGRYVHASSVAGRVIVSPIHRRPADTKPWRGARRLFAFADVPQPTGTADQ